ncbi:hypothetical protein FHS72_002470 [Loktanella ponticola]|uniref:Uncharacterized protein n=1 Tax=Yoonia ponticola TaxID=1524255 RepID=A0A7W9BLW1_9RHOB|nr:hypothetical protein [Yoonia ponticola]
MMLKIRVKTRVDRDTVKAQFVACLINDLNAYLLQLCDFDIGTVYP